uniref:E3 ubiquitin-protein ligase RNF126-like n=1 Tax=Erigeron canadensis TaxID=72917 RepID=UPI001CB89354|nr:E3 ubiquitin-protein ligase RNF126-like [Erigeron canadensis]
MASTATTHRCNSSNPNDDNYGLSSPHFQRLITHHSTSSSKSTVKSITITPAFLATDKTNILCCAICKEDFLTNDQTKQLPCTHLYHSQCILPWLSDHTSCPLCRFQLPQNLVDATLLRESDSNRSLSMSDDEEGLDDETMLRIGFDNLDDQMYLEPVASSRISVAFPYYHQREPAEIDDDLQLFINDDDNGQLEWERELPPRSPNSESGVGGELEGIAPWDVWAHIGFWST